MAVSGLKAPLLHKGEALPKHDLSFPSLISQSILIHAKAHLQPSLEISLSIFAHRSEDVSKRCLTLLLFTGPHRLAWQRDGTDRIQRGLTVDAHHAGAHALYAAATKQRIKGCI